MKKLDVVAAVIEKQDLFLVAHHKQHQAWEFPGGKVEKNETHRSALVREIQEELQMRIQPLSYIHTAELPVKAGSDTRILLHAYRCVVLNEEGLALIDHDEILWCKKKDPLPEKVDLLFGDQLILESYLKKEFNSHYKL